MSTPVEALMRTYLASTGVTTSATGYYLRAAPQGTTAPYGVVSKISAGTSYHLEGVSGLKVPRMQVSCFGDTYQQAKTLAGEVITKMHLWTGSTDIEVQGVFLENETDIFETDTQSHHVPLDFFVAHIIL